MAIERFVDRHDAGQQLALELEKYRGEEPIILGLPRGGVVCAYEVAFELEAALDVLHVRKIGAPGHQELAVGAVVDGSPPVVVVNEDIVETLRLPKRTINREAVQKLKEIAARKLLYSQNISLDARGRTVIVVDDGIATGATVRAALRGLEKMGTKRRIVAVPVAPLESLAQLKSEADELICLQPVDNFVALSLHYENFDQVTDAEVLSLLQKAHARAEEASG